ncbi:MAG: hypothetical protein QXT63_09315 [Thermoplasmata archaeon]
MFPISIRTIGKGMTIYGLVLFFYEGIAVLRFPNMLITPISNVFPISATVLMLFSIGTSFIGFLIWQNDRELSLRETAQMGFCYALLLSVCGMITFLRSGRIERDIVALLFIVGAFTITAFSIKGYFVSQGTRS